MSEELVQQNLLKKGEMFGDKYEYYSIGKTTINQLKKSNIIPDKNYGKYKKLKPDGLLVDRRNPKNIRVIAVIEYKLSDEFNSQEKKDEAIKQCNTYCELLDSKIAIATDNQETVWANPQVEVENAKNTYIDNEIFKNDSFDKKRGFDFIEKTDGFNLSNPFVLDKEKMEETESTLKVINKILEEISPDNSKFKKKEYKNPYNLAKQVWQDVWISKNADPEEALSTFVEVFMFRFLSDLGVLKEDDQGHDINFEAVYSKSEKKCLKYYYSDVRDYIKKELFPYNQNDKTTLINGISLNPNIEEDNIVFHNILTKFKNFVDEYGDLKFIDPDFKSRLFEEFLKKSISKKNWGQFFTPRNVVKAIVEMSNIDSLPEGAKVCDPACGVGGFILEPLIDKIPNNFYFDKGELKSKLKFYGFEKGFEKDDKITFTLAKANFVIYLSNLVRENPTLTKEFAKIYNKIFKMYTDTILGSLSEVDAKEYDLIMSNPPYVVSGSSNLKNAIEKNKVLKTNYTTNAAGTEGLFLEKMIKELKKGGDLLVVIPIGILERKDDKELRKLIRRKCIINGIVSLPSKTFYNTPQKTYILSLTKKEDPSIVQDTPVFTYLATSVGETLDVYRFETENDLKDMARQYNYFMSNKIHYEGSNLKCKIQSIDLFDEDNYWTIDRLWTKEEKIELGIDENNTITLFDMQEKIDELKNKVEDIKDDLDSIESSDDIDYKSQMIKYLFLYEKGNSDYTKGYIREKENEYPVYSSQTENEGLYGEIDTFDYDVNGAITWTSDGVYAGTPFYREGKFNITGHAGVLIPDIYIYSLYVWEEQEDKSLYLSLKKYYKENFSEEEKKLFKNLFKFKTKNDFDIKKMTDPQKRNRGKMKEKFKMRKEFIQKIPLEIWEEYTNVNLDYVYIELKKNLKDYALGTDNKRVTLDIISKVEILIPEKIEEDSFDLEIQKNVARKYKKIETARKEIVDYLEEFNNIEEIEFN